MDARAAPARVLRIGRLVVEEHVRVLRQAAMDRLVQLDEHGQLTSELVLLTAQALGVAERTVWRWLRARRSQAVPVRRERFSIDERLRVRLAYWRGNAAALSTAGQS